MPVRLAKLRPFHMSKCIMADNSTKEAKARRLAEQLRANLQRRKQQARARREGESVRYAGAGLLDTRLVNRRRFTSKKALR